MDTIVRVGVGGWKGSDFQRALEGHLSRPGVARDELQGDCQQIQWAPGDDRQAVSSVQVIGLCGGRAAL